MHRLPAWLACLLVLAACGRATAPPPDLEPAAPYQTVSPSPSFTPLPALTEILLPTPTPILYTVAKGDTLEAIANQYGVSLEALLGANPGLQPAALPVGTQLVIPADAVQTAAPAPTPAPVPVRQARCWPESSGGLWCFALLQNEFAETLEDLSAQFILLDRNGDEIASQAAYAPLDRLPAGASMPLGVHFPAPVDQQALPRLQVLTAIRLLPGEARYLSVMLENILVRVESSRRSAQVSGRVLLTAPGVRAATLRVLAIAYDDAGNLVGFRRWEASKPLTEGESLTFELLVSSLGAGIERVEFLAEALP